MPALCSIFLRGGADALALVPPHADDRLYELRPTLAPPRPDDRRASERAIDLDGRFGLHPALAPLSTLFEAKELAVVHAIGSDDETRSHFEAQDRMELAGATALSASGGWIARHLATRPGARPGPLAAVALGPRSPQSLRGAAVTALERASEFGVPALAGPLGDALSRLYAASIEDAPGLPLARDLGGAATGALSVARTLEDLARRGGPRAGRYPAGAFGARLAEAAHLLRNRVELGVEVVTVDHDGYDTHFVQNQALPGLAADLGGGLAAFREDLGDAFDDTVVLVMTEFGRRAYENVSLGTDHGRASFMIVAGGGVLGRRVLGRFPGLSEADLTVPGDLTVTTDYRSVLAEVVAGPLGNLRAGEVFPGAPHRPSLGLFGAS
jgi:uncharacterized protein (DUF1501 family)